MARGATAKAEITKKILEIFYTMLKLENWNPSLGKIW
jgi:hypothetical protein